jgi:ABC-type transport system involved in Fe-S cluster assembly fused permease/ATPase subunit
MHSTGKGDATLIKEANLLCGDAIVNYKTVQSFGNEDLLVDKYKELLYPVQQASYSQHIMAGFGMGFSQLANFGLQAGMFFFASIFIERDHPNLKVEDVFTALFCIMFSASWLGSSLSLGPDVGKATGAASKIFTIMEDPS